MKSKNNIQNQENNDMKNKISKEKQMIKTKVIIIGSGFAGTNAAIYLHQGGFSKNQITLISGNQSGGQISTTSEVTNYLTYLSISGSELADKIFEHANNYSNIVFDSVLNIEIKNHLKYVTTENNIYECEYLIIASGSNPKKLGLSSEEKFNNKGVSYCAICDGFLYKENVAVIGGGNTALEEAIYLAKSGTNRKVYLIHRRSEFRAFDALQKELNELILAEKVELILEAEVEEFIGDATLNSLKIRQNNETIVLNNICGAFVAIGHNPNSNFINCCKKNEFNNIIVTDKYEVLDKNNKIIFGLYACGDVISFYSGRNFFKQGIVAGAMGCETALRILENLKKI